MLILWFKIEFNIGKGVDWRVDLGGYQLGNRKWECVIIWDI